NDEDPSPQPHQQPRFDCSSATAAATRPWLKAYPREDTWQAQNVWRCGKLEAGRGLHVACLRCELSVSRWWMRTCARIKPRLGPGETPRIDHPDYGQLSLARLRRGTICFE